MIMNFLEGCEENGRSRCSPASSPRFQSWISTIETTTYGEANEGTLPITGRGL